MSYQMSAQERENVALAAKRISEIKAEIKALQDEDARIKAWLDRELLVDQMTGGVQTFDCGGITVKATVPQNMSIDEQALYEISQTNPEAKPFMDQLFRLKIEINKGVWNRMEPAAQQIFAGAVTIKPGKTSYEFIIAKED